MSRIVAAAQNAVQSTMVVMPNVKKRRYIVSF